ncbi:hypothetical protein [Cereibacter changlensis]|uniref:hypothetical protein n=1 Tax=Cereibacter changlensis TaxID=402884 RepID=UPI001B80AAB5|nr:hypothetical protein [Cereibacter changlensis]
MTPALAPRASCAALAEPRSRSSAVSSPSRKGRAPRLMSVTKPTVGAARSWSSSACSSST